MPAWPCERKSLNGSGIISLVLFLAGIAEDSGEEAWQSSPARIMMSSEQRVPQLESLATLIKVHIPCF